MKITQLAGIIDWPLLVFLTLFLDVKIYLKIFALPLIYAYQFNFRFGFTWRNSRLPLFYPGILALAVVNWIMLGLFENRNYTFALAFGSLFWVLSILAIHQVKLYVERIDGKVLHNTLRLFFVLNALVSFAVLGKIIIETGSLNPFTYQGDFQKYFIKTGDYIKGLTFDTSTTNAIINSIGVIYFLFKKEVRMVLLCMSVLLLTGSNTLNVLMLGCLMCLFIFKSDRDQKSMIALSLAMLVLFLAQISPQNKSYAQAIGRRFLGAEWLTEKISELSMKEELGDSLANYRQEVAGHYVDSVSYLVSIQRDSVDRHAKMPTLFIEDLPVADINRPYFQQRDDTNSQRRALIAFAKTPVIASAMDQIGVLAEKYPGKVLAVRQTTDFMKQHPRYLVTGVGMGRFSSKLAYRTTALGFEGKYPSSLRYLNADFGSNHLALYLYYFIRQAELHSIINTPDSVYDQLFSEYGTVGIVFFLLGYLGFFVRKWNKLTYGLPLLVLLMACFAIGYWFEQLSVVVLFELLLLFDLKESPTYGKGA